jgi:hypothetical protein
MPVTFPRRVTSTATQILVSGLPAWLPAAGSWAQVSLNKAADVKGDHPNFPSSRSLDFLFTDFTGAVWNPHIGTLGAYLLHGGGHQQYLGNEVYAWKADTRQWEQLTVPTYPGTNSGGTSLVTLGDWTAFKEPPFASDLLETYGELALNIPASNHSRWHPCVLSPALGGGSSGSLLIPHQSAVHTSSNGSYKQGHRFDCSTLQWSRLGGLNQISFQYDLKAFSSCIDTQRGDVWTFGTSNASRYNVAGNAHTDIAISGYRGSGFEYKAAVYVPTVDRILLITGDWAMRMIDPSSPGTMATPTISGANPGTVVDQNQNGVWCPDLGANGAVVCMNFTAKIVKALYAPSLPSGTWTWATLSASNSPSYGDAQWWYHRLQYAPALKSFFIASLAEGTLNSGGMWCFRPSEIP